MNQNIQENQFSRSDQRLSRNIMKISDHQLGTKFRSKYDIYCYLTEALQLYMPPKDLVTKDFLKQILRNEKYLMKSEEIKFIKVPKYPELSVKSLIQQIQEDEEIKKYFPNIDSMKKPLDREYFFNILNTVYPEYVKTLIEHAQNIRNDPSINENKKDYILISDEWYSKLMSHPFISKKPGKTVQLLKESTKILKGRRQRKIQDIGISLKRFKGTERDQASLSQLQHTLQKEQINEDYDFEQSEDQSPQRKRIFQI